MFAEKNRKILLGRFPRLEAEIFSKYVPADDVEIISSRSGHPTCRSGEKLLHSRHDPVREAEKIVQQNYEPQADCIVLLGFGLGYYAEACSKYYPDAHLCIVEPDVPLFLKALESRDLSNLWNRKEITLLLAPEPSAITAVLGVLQSQTCQVIALRTAYEASADFFTMAEKAVKDHLSRRQINTNTLKRFGKLWIRNLSRNIPVLPSAGDVASFKDSFRGIPALLLAGGPTLTRLLPHLQELKKRFVLIAVDTTLRACGIAGVKPDVLIVVDPQYWNTRHLDGCSLDGLVLISESSTHPKIFRPSECKGSGADGLYFCRSLFPLGRYIDDFTGVTGKLGAGGSVATTAWDFCRYAGAPEIICAGLDLGFPGRQTHFKGSFFEERSHTLSGRLDPSETHSFSYLRSGDPFPALDYTGNPVLTDRRMSLYRWWFEDQLKQHPECITRYAGDCGTRVDGIRPIEYQTLLAYPEIRDKIDSVILSFKHSEAETGAEARRTEPLLRGIERLTEELCSLSSTADKALNAVEKLEKEIRTGDEPAGGFQELDRLDDEILTASSKEIAGFIMQRTVESIKPVPAEGSRQERFAAVLENSRRLYEGIRESAQYNRRMLDRALRFMSTASGPLHNKKG